MDDHKKNVRVLGELLGQQPDEFIGGVTVIHGQGTANAKHASLFPQLSGDVAAIACLRAEMLSRQRPCSARLMAFSGDKGDRGCGRSFGIAERRGSARARNTQ